MLLFLMTRFLSIPQFFHQGKEKILVLPATATKVKLKIHLACSMTTHAFCELYPLNPSPSSMPPPPPPQHTHTSILVPFPWHSVNDKSCGQKLQWRMPVILLNDLILVCWDLWQVLCTPLPFLPLPPPPQPSTVQKNTSGPSLSVRFKET